MNLKRFKRSKNENEDGSGADFALVIQGEKEAPLMQLPEEVTTPLRYTISRMISEEGLPERLALVAALRGEGVSFLSLALGALLANDYARNVCVVELNWWWPASASAAVGHTHGIAQYIGGEASWEECVVTMNLPNLAFLPAGHVDEHQRARVARGPGLREALDTVSEHFDHLILDIPAILATSDAVPLARSADCCYLVVHQGITPMEKVNLALDEIRNLPIGGVIMNQVETATPGWILKFIPQG